ncbi:TenA family protein [Allorhizobium borbori]|uniref:Thiaminase/transcriptional activator TenA n=1 Tax=Allorhizobium borbori TaxID=485907 RepID=A0A7W6K1Z1_9HYPH|nr:TenA family protein [Allorhizobium borbori]MBB4102781.1 thiaminase/transcriptional activator TenA [Allorhizobium borbori]
MTHPPFDRLKDTCRNDWQAYCEHDFLVQLACGTLPEDAFRHYLKQDYLFLVHFARAWGLAVYKSGDLAEIRSALATLKAIVDIEIDLHIGYCREWGIEPQDLATLPEARPTMAYTRYVLDAGHRGDLLDLHVALAPCVVGYAEIARWIMAQPFTVLDGNPYAAWIEMYAGDEFQEAAMAEVDWLNARLGGVAPDRFSALARTFRDATRLEIDFWQMGLDLRE